MDTGEGRFAGLAMGKYQELKEKQAKGLFKVGEWIKIHGSTFKVMEITETGRLELALLSEQEVQERSVIDDLRKSFESVDFDEHMEKKEHRLKSTHQARTIFNKNKIHQ